MSQLQKERSFRSSNWYVQISAGYTAGAQATPAVAFIPRLGVQLVIVLSLYSPETSFNVLTI